MRLSLAIKTLFRSPLRTLLTFVLLAAAAFMLVYCAVDYSIIMREYNNVLSEYKGVLSVEHEALAKPAKPAFPYYLLSEPSNKANYDGYFKYDEYHQPNLNKEYIDKIMQLPYITKLSVRYMGAGVSYNTNRVDKIGDSLSTSLFNYSARCIFEATLDKVAMSDVERMSESSYYTSYFVNFQNLYVSDVKILAGNPEWLMFNDIEVSEGQHRIRAIIPTSDYYKQHKTISVNTAISRIILAYRNNHISEKDITDLYTGERYVFVTRVEPYTYSLTDGSNFYPSFFFGDDTLYDWCPYIYYLEGQPENYLELDKFASLRELIQITNDDLKTLDVVYTDSMSSIRRVAEDKILLTEGRFIEPKDSEEKKPVCVVSDTFMKENNLKLGDTLKIKLGNKLFEQYAPLGTVASTKDRYSTNFVDSEFIIIGSYVDINSDKMRDADQYWAYSDNTVFVPLSFLPLKDCDLEGHEFKPGEVSFVIDDPRNINPFMEECIPQIEAMGLTVYFYDNGWLGLEEQFNQVGLLSLIKLLAFTAASVLAVILTVFLFIGRKKREYAVMRALGTTRQKAGRTLLIPLLTVTLFAVIIGGAASAIYASQMAEETLKPFAELGLKVDASIPILIVAAAMLYLIFLITLFALAVLYILGKKPPLLLISKH
jgi:hypothetical protein